MSGSIETLRNVMTLLRESVIVFVLLLFLILPGRVNSVLTRAGFTKASFAGFEVDLQASLDKTKSASETLLKLEDQLKEMKARLDEIGRKSSEPVATSINPFRSSALVIRTRFRTTEGNRDGLF
jgi:hypothetical protein